MVDGLLILLLFQFLGELVIHFTGLPLPAREEKRAALHC